MINANELRLGNWIKIELGYRQVSCVQGHCILVPNWYEGVPLVKDVYPILLTPEILISCGIEQANFRNEYRFVDNFLVANGDGTFDLIIGDAEVSIATIKYVHQLQNLYFALTNSEIEINL